MSENMSATRRNVIVGAGAGGLAAVLAACGGSDSSGSGASSTAAAGGSSGSALASTSAIPVGGGTVFKDQKVVVTQPKAGEFKAFTATCTHQGCTVGTVSGGTINCPCHGSKFDIADGSVANGPATKPLAAKKIIVKGGKISLA
jgi:Rieske Fe-S protein